MTQHKEIRKKYQDAIDKFIAEVDFIDSAHSTYAKIYCEDEITRPLSIHGIAPGPIRYVRGISVEDIILLNGED